MRFAGSIISRSAFGRGAAFVVLMFALAAMTTPAHAQRVEQVSGGGYYRVHVPSGVVVNDGRQWALQPAAGDEGGIAGPGVGRCCLANGECELVTFVQCQALDGVYMGDNSTCSEFDCGQLGRCCINDDFVVSCEYVNLATCFNELGGSYWQPGVTCEQSPCAPFGSCCRDFGGGPVCYITAQFLCEAQGGVWQGDNVPCDQVNCESVGVCCTAIGCLPLSEKECEGKGTWLAGADCKECRDLSLGACCFDEFTCDLLTAGECDDRGGVYFGDGTRCDDFEVDCSDFPQTGPCCINSQCYTTTEPVCEYFLGTFAGVGEECDFVNCALPGACCLNNGLACEVMDEGLCNKMGGTFAGGGTECSSGAGGTCPDYLGKCCLQNPDGTSYCLTLNIDECFSIPGSVWWATPGVCEDPGAPHCPVFGACCKPDGTCQVVDQNICETFFNGVYRGDGTTCADSDNNGVAEACEEPGDINGDGAVDINDLLAVIGAWGPCPAPCVADIYPSPMPNGVVNIDDLLTVISNWG